MGKKQGEAARVKGNAKPSSSAKAAEMLSQIPNYSFGADMPPIGIGTLMEDSFDSNVDSDFRMVLKKLSKKDTLTKIKSLEELKCLIDVKSQDDCANIVSYWAKSYTKLSIDNDRKIREMCQQTHEKLCAKITKSIAPHIKTLMPYWLIAQCDSHLTAAKIAEACFKSIFNEQKQPEVIYFCRDEILNTLHDFLIIQTAKTLSDMKSTSEDEAVQKYENILSMAMKALGLFLNFFLSDVSKVYKEKYDWSKLEKILVDQKFWKYSRDQNIRLKSEFFSLLFQLIDLILLNKNIINLEEDGTFMLRKNLRVKIIPLIFYALDEDNEICCYYVWQSIMKCLIYSDQLNSNSDNFWALLNVKKAFIPKLISLLRSHANANANILNIEIIYPCLSKLLSNLTFVFELLDEKIYFYKEYLTKIYELIVRDLSSVQKIRFSNPASNRSKIFSCYFESINIILDDLKFQDEKSNEFLNSVIFEQVSKIFALYLDLTTDGFGFENNFNKFQCKLESNEFLRSYWDKYLINLNKILLEKIQSNENLDKQLNVLKNYLNLNIKDSILLKQIFKLYINKITDSPEHLVVVNYLVSKAFVPEFIDLIIEDHFKDFKLFSENLFKNSSCLILKVEFYVLILIKQNQTTDLPQNLDQFIFSQSRTSDALDDFVKNLVESLKLKKFDNEISKVLIKWIKTSAKVQEFISNSLLTNFVHNTTSIYDLSQILQDENFTNELGNKIYDLLRQLEKIDDSVIELNLSLLNEVSLKSNSHLLWKLLFEYFRIKISQKSKSLQLETIIKKLINLLVSSNLFEPLKNFIALSLNDENTYIVEILQEILSEISKTKDTDFIKNFTKTVLLNDSFKFKEIFESLLKNNDILSKLFINKRLNYLYTDLHWNLIKHKENLDQEWLSTVTLNKITYSLSQLNSYLILNSNDLYSDWYYLILCSILIDKFYTGTKNISSFRAEFQNLTSKFLNVLTNKMNEDTQELEQFVNEHFSDNDISFSLNNLSLFLTYSIDLTSSKTLEIFAQNIMGLVISLYVDQEEQIKMFVYDIPFARQSVLDNLDNLIDNLDHYYELFSSVLESGIQKLEYLTQVLEVLNKDQDLPLLETNLKNFNLCLDLIIKYVNFYFDLLKSKNDSKLESIFNQNQKTNEFIQNSLSDYMLRVLDLFLRIKISINDNLESLIKGLSLDEYGSGYFFYFNLSNEPKTRLNWEEIVFNYKLNEFLCLFFIQIPQNQLSVYLSDKKWDFLLCYSSAMSQRFKKPIDTSLKDKTYLQLIISSFYDFLFGLVNCLKNNVQENPKYPKQIYSDWSGFFSKEVMDPILVNFVKVSQDFDSKSLNYVNKILVNKISNIVGQITFERIIINELEPKFNVMDIEITNLSDQIKSIFNHLVPFLKHKIGSIQLGAYKILKVLLMNIGSYFSEDIDIKIFESLPFVFRDIFYELTDLFSDLKKSVEFDHNILNFDEDLTHESNNHIMSYLLINKLVLDMFWTNNLQFKVKLASNLRELTFSDYLMHCLFRLMPKICLEKFVDSQDDALIVLNDDEIYFKNEFVENFACKLYKQTLKMCPAMIRDWWNMQPKRIADQVDKFTTKYVSPILIEEEIKQINRSANLLNNESGSEDESSIKIKGMTSTREIVSTYKMKELSMDLLIQLPINYPLGVIDVSSAKRLGVSENEWRNWLLQLTTYLTHQNGSIIQGLQIWKRNVDKKFAGVEECTICYSVIHGTNYQLPKMKCRTCKHMFHSVCLYKWFESSSKSSCPLCRNLF